MLTLNTLFGPWTLGAFEVFGVLLFLHLLFDYALQGDFMAKAKNHKLPFVDVPPFLILLSHGFLHAFAVYAVTRSFYLFFLELVLHCSFDRLKCHKVISYELDQFLHVMTKVVILAILIANKGQVL